MQSTQIYKSNSEMLDNVEIVLRDAKGNIKPIWQENALATRLMKQGIITPHHLKIALFGKWAQVKLGSNLITNAGRAIVSGLINGSGTPAAFTQIAVGTGTTAAAVTDTALVTETTVSGLARAAGTVSRITTTVTNDTAQVTNTYTVTGTVAVTEAGLFNAASGVTILARQVFSAINVVNGDSLQITWKIQNT